VIGLHFFSPANVMRLLEIVRGKATAADVLVTAMSLAKRIKKVAVVAGVCDGFIGNRMIARYGQAAHDLLLAGASPEQIDKAVEKFGMAMGPFRMNDLAGLDVGAMWRKRLAAENPDKDYANIADLLVDAGRYGQKTAAGWYRYPPGSRTPVPDPEVKALIEKFRAERHITPRKVTDAEVVQRCIYALVNEGARILEDGIAQRSSDIDIVYLYGYGFPAWRGGPMFYADQVGLMEVARDLKRIAASAGPEADFWQPAALLRRLAAEGKAFSQHTGAVS
jgi:3-hydroxyacyl-CoA dehydrogenase